VDLLPRLALGLAAGALIGALGYARGSLAPSGVLGAILVGTPVFALGGIGPGLLLIAFFISSSALSHYKRLQKEAVAGDKFSKGARRDVWQALANGGLAALLALGAYALPGAFPWLAALAGALGTVNADTWATEIGVLSRARPLLITSGRPVEPGTSGGITLLGTSAALAGALFIGGLAELLDGAWGVLSSPSLSSPQAGGMVAAAPGALLLAAAAGGLAGALFDSVLGATVQAIYYCDTCAKETEREVHSCGARTRRLRGWAWLDNDWVNFLASAAGALVGAACGALLR
jgi:uncharacterized protein (TIGR00297 family)